MTHSINNFYLQPLLPSQERFARLVRKFQVAGIYLIKGLPTWLKFSTRRPRSVRVSRSSPSLRSDRKSRTSL